MATSVASPGIRIAPRLANAVFGSDGSREAANRILQITTRPKQGVDIPRAAAIFRELAKTHPKLAQNAFADVLSRLRPAQQGELQRLVGKSLVSPKTMQNRADQGQDVLKGASSSVDLLSDSAAAALKVKGAAKLAPLPAKIAFMTVDAKMKYDELRAMGFSHGAANAGMIAGQAAGVGASGTGSVAGGWVGGVLTSWSGPGAILGAGGGAVIGGAIGGGIDWFFDLSDNAALAAANTFDGKNLK